MRNLVLALVVSISSPAPLGARAETLTLVAFGDSLTRGFGLPETEGFVPQLQGWLSARGADVRVVNAGVSGETTAGGAARIGWTLEGSGADALIVTLGGNDVLRGLPPEEARANLAAILTESRSRGLPVMLVGMQAAGNFGPDYKQAFDAIYTDLAGEFGALYGGNFLGALTDLPDRQTALRDLMQPDGLHPNARGVALIVEALGPEVLRLIDAARGDAG